MSDTNEIFTPEENPENINVSNVDILKSILKEADDTESMGEVE